VSHLKVAAVGLLVLAVGVAPGLAAQPPDVLSLVDPFVGTGGHGHTYPGATVPFGMVQVSPDTHTSGWDWCSGYHYSDRSIMGFSLTHLSGTGIGDMLDVLLMPTVGPLRLEPGAREQPDSGYRSRFSHAGEKASPGYYSVRLADTGIGVELTATERVGLQRYTFPASDAAHVVLDLDHRVEADGWRSEVLDSEIELRGNDTIVGWRRVTRWAVDRHVYFAARFSKPFAAFGLLVGTEQKAGLRQARGKRLKAWVDYRTTSGETVLVRVAISPTGVLGALRNLEAEAPRADFDGARTAAAGAWHRALSRIAIEGGTKKQRRTFYSALYHAFLAPTLFDDADGSYRGLDGQVRKAEGFHYHSTFSLWDTYRAAHPLYCLVQRERTRDLARTLVRMAVESPAGQMAVWPLANDETNCMIGYHSASVLAEAWAKGIHGFDLPTAFDHLKAMATKSDYRGLGAYGRLGWVPSDEEGESVSKTLEYSYDDFCIAQVARALGRDEREYLRRAGSWRNVFDPATGFARPRLADGTYPSPFDPARYGVSTKWHDYTEGNAWQYTFAAQHDAEGYVRALGGSEALVRKLDLLFGTPLDTRAAGLPDDVSGLVGQYAHGNEPSHHVAYLYTYAGAPWKTAERVRGILDTMYGDTPDGLSGNEDCGQMSSWYVLSALGFYPVNPASATYVLASPLFDRATVDLGEGRRFTVRVDRSSPADVYVQSATLGGKPLPRAWITHGEVMTAGELRVVLGPRPNPAWATGVGERPPSMTAAGTP
jgi:predicted alpha-1,2-mannosidase